MGSFLFEFHSNDQITNTSTTQLMSPSPSAGILPSEEWESARLIPSYPPLLTSLHKYPFPAPVLAPLCASPLPPTSLFVSRSLALAYYYCYCYYRYHTTTTKDHWEL